MLDMFAGPDRNKTIMLAVAVVAIAVIGVLFAAGRLPGISSEFPKANMRKPRVKSARGSSPT